MDQVGRYQILEELGRGAHGVVYKALDPAIGRTIAIKAIALGNIEIAERTRVREGILREAKLAGTLSHANIVTVYDVLDSGDSAFIIMEFVDGRSLEEAIGAAKYDQPDKLSRSAFLSVLKQVAQGLDYAHRKGVIHRDIKPANIVLTNHAAGTTDVPPDEPLAKIADFGVAKFSSQEATQQLGGTPSPIGTPSYMSPEQVQGIMVTGASDQFSLAVIAYEVLCGRKPFAADTVEALLYRIRHDREQGAHLANTMLSTTVTKVLFRALSKNPQERFGSCSEFAGALEFALGDSPTWAPGATRTLAERARSSVVVFEPDEPEEERTWVRNLIMIGALCLAVAVAIVLIVRMNSGPAVATQVLDSKNGPVTAPSVEELKYDRHITAPPLDLSAPPAAPQAAPQPAKKAESVVRVPVAPKAQPPVPTVKASMTKPLPPRAEKPQQPASTRSGVEMITDPPGVAIRVDGTSSCVTPCSLTLANGRHTLVANMQGFGVSRKIFYLPADKNILVPMVKSQGVLLVSSEPSGARVSVDGQTAGATPVTLRLTPGTHHISVWDGARWHDESVQVGADEVHTRLFRF